MSTAVWNVDILRDYVRTYVLEKLADDDGILILDDTQVIKKGTKRLRTIGDAGLATSSKPVSQPV